MFKIFIAYIMNMSKFSECAIFQKSLVIQIIILTDLEL